MTKMKEIKRQIDNMTSAEDENDEMKSELLILAEEVKRLTEVETNYLEVFDSMKKAVENT